MYKEQFTIYLQALIDDYNTKARACSKHGVIATHRFEKSKARLNGAVTAAKMLGEEIEITYVEPTYYYSEIIINN